MDKPLTFDDLRTVVPQLQGHAQGTDSVIADLVRSVFDLQDNSRYDLYWHYFMYACILLVLYSLLRRVGNLEHGRS